MIESTGMELDSERIQVNLKRAGMLLLAYEFLKQETVDRVREEFVSKGKLDEYEAKFPKKSHPRLKATCAWLVENGAFSQGSAANIIDIAKHRHEVAHEIFRFILDPDADVETKFLRSAFAHLTTLSMFWQARGIDSSMSKYEVFTTRAHLPSIEAIVMRYVLQVAEVGTEDGDP